MSDYEIIRAKAPVKSVKIQLPPESWRTLRSILAELDADGRDLGPRGNYILNLLEDILDEIEKEI